MKNKLKELAQKIKNLLKKGYNRIRNRQQTRRTSTLHYPHYPHRHNVIRVHRVLPYILVIIAILWANKQELFQDYPGLQKCIDLYLKIIEEFYKFTMEIVDKLFTHFDISGKWERFQDWFWNNLPF